MISLKEIRKKDYKKAIQFAITGMHFNMYLENKTLLNLYGKYFWYSELNQATQVITAYEVDDLVGVLLADMKGEEKRYRSMGRTLFVMLFELLQGIFSKDGAGVYERANVQMEKEYLQSHTPDGQIVFLAANPQIKTKGIGSMLLREFESREEGKEVFLYTDDACTYQFYEHRGFERCGERDVVLDFGSKSVPLKCFLYRKRIS